MTDIMVDIPDFCMTNGCAKPFGHNLDPSDPCGPIALLDFYEYLLNKIEHLVRRYAQVDDVVGRGDIQANNFYREVKSLMDERASSPIYLAEED